jgi:hypothetical protein
VLTGSSLELQCAMLIDAARDPHAFDAALKNTDGLVA